MEKPSKVDGKSGKVTKPRKALSFTASAESGPCPMDTSDGDGNQNRDRASSKSPEKVYTDPKGSAHRPGIGHGQKPSTVTTSPSTSKSQNVQSMTQPKPKTTHIGEGTVPKTSAVPSENVQEKSDLPGTSTNTRPSNVPNNTEGSPSAVPVTSSGTRPAKHSLPKDSANNPPAKGAKLWTATSKLNINVTAKKPQTPTKNPQYTRKYHACTDINDTFSSSSSVKGDYPAYTSTNSSRQGRPNYMSTPSKFKPTSIQDLLFMDTSVQIETQMTFNVVYLQEFMPKHPKVMKNRRRMVLADKSGCINAFILKADDVTFDEGDTVSIQEFKYNDKAIIVHEGSVAIRIQPRDLPGNILEQAQAFVNKPKMPVMGIAAAMRRPHLTRVAVEGTVIKIERPRVTTPKKDDTKEKVVRDIKVQDASGIVRMSLWEGAAIYCEVALGDHVIVSDASVSYNGMYNSKVMNVQFPDMIIFLPPIMTTEQMEVIGIDETGTESLFMFLLKEGSKFDRLTVPLEVLLRAFNLDTEPTVRDLLPCLPFKAIMKIKGVCVQDCTILSLPESAVMRTDDSYVSSNQFSDLTDEQLLAAEGEDVTNPSDNTLDNGDVDDKVLDDDCNI